VTISRIILLTGETEAPFLTEQLKAHNPALAVDSAANREALARLCDGAEPGTRLISFCSPVIVPGAILTALPGPAYNFHPGPPERPGRYPSVFALYDNDSRFGITVHEMAAKVDTGPIVAAEWFAVPDGCDLETLESLTFAALAAKFRTLAFHLAAMDRPLPRLPIQWSGTKTTKSDRDALSYIAPDLDAAEAERRRRACGGMVVEG